MSLILKLQSELYKLRIDNHVWSDESRLNKTNPEYLSIHGPNYTVFFPQTITTITDTHISWGAAPQVSDFFEEPKNKDNPRFKLEAFTAYINKLGYSLEQLQTRPIKRECNLSKISTRGPKKAGKTPKHKNALACMKAIKTRRRKQTEPYTFSP